MSRITKLMSAIAALAGGASLSAALPVVTVLAPAPSDAYLHVITGDDVFIYSNPQVAAPNVANIVVSTAQPNQALGTITVKVADAGKRVQLFVERNEGPVLRVHSILRDSSPQSLGEVWLQNLFTHEDVGQGDRTANPPSRSGQIFVNRVGQIVSQRNIFADITVVAGAQSAAQNGIDLVRTIYNPQLGGNPTYIQDGSLHGNIDAGPRGIGELNIANTIASITANPIVIASGGDVGTIKAGAMGTVSYVMPNAVVSEFRTTQGGWGGDATCNLFEIGSQGEPICNNPLSIGGSITAKRIEKLVLKKNLESIISVAEAPSPTQVWRIGRSFKFPGEIYLPAGGLKNQIVINQQLLDGDWFAGATIHVGQDSLEKGYSLKPSDLGGGYAGVVSYDLYGAASTPIPGTQHVEGAIDPNSMIEPPPCVYGVEYFLHFYGPVFLADNVPPTGVITVQEWDWSIADYRNVTLEPGESYQVFVNGSRSLRIQRLTGTTPVPWRLNRAYRLILNQGVVRANELPEDPQAPIVGPFVPPLSYSFFLVNGCQQAFDQDSNGLVDANDIPAWLATPTDIDSSGSATDRDLRALIHGVVTWPNP